MDSSHEYTGGLSEDCEALVLSHCESPDVSVIVPVHNEGASGFLRQCIESLLAQSLKGLEIVFVDDASTDDSLSVLLNCASQCSNVSILHLRENMRQGAARNRGISIARGRYIGFVDSDDTIEPNYFESLFREAVRTHADLVGAPLRTIDVISGSLSEPQSALLSEDIGLLDDAKRARLIGRPPSVCQCVFRATILREERNAFPERMLYEDTPAVARWVYCIQSTAQVLNTCYNYRMNPVSTCHITAENRSYLDDRIRSSDMILDDAIAFGVYEKYKEAIDGYYFRVCAINTISLLCSTEDAPDLEYYDYVVDHVVNRIGSPDRFLRKRNLSFRAFVVWNLLWRSPKLFHRLNMMRKKA